MSKIALIDCDSLIWIIAYNYKDNPGSETEVRESCDSFLRDILALSGCDRYIGAFSDTTNFRYRNYKFAPYKGNRPPRPEFMDVWSAFTIAYYVNKHKFIVPVDLEADDIISGLACTLKEPYVICSPDKDLRQLPGEFYDYRKQVEPEAAFNAQIITVTPDQAHRNFWMQMIMGDSSDNVKAIPGLGEVKAKKLLDEALDPLMYKTIVLQQYQKAFGTYYGDIIFKETAEALMLLRPEHPQWNSSHPLEKEAEYYYKDQVLNAACAVQTLNTAPSIFDI